MESIGSPGQEDEHIVQLREALMCPDGEKFEGLRTARFLKYTTTCIDDNVFELPLDVFAYRSSEANDSEKTTTNVSFSGWRSPSLNWIEWVNAMAESHATVWKESGVHDAIMASRYQIKKREDLIMALVEKWCIETNTFVFPWGEATVTLEDMIVLGGFSVIGNNALAPIKRDDMKEVEEKLKKVKLEIEANSEKKKKCCVSSWMKEMMNSGNEIEHEAFMVSWLSRFVFPNSADLLKEKLFPTAIQLTKGVKVALAPAVLARIYCDIGVLKEHLIGCRENEMVVKSPFQFVQVWALERIMELQPPGQPSQLKPGEPRIARWQHHGGIQDVYGYHGNVRVVLDSAKESFDYRPYTKPLMNFRFPKFYLEDDSWVHVRPDESIVAFARCLRFAKLVGLDCIEPYYPHRVALQFGYDQDVPGMVPARTESPELAWKDYIRPISDEVLYVPARLHEADVTIGYIRWWKLSVAVLQSEAKKFSHKLLASPPKHKPVTNRGTSGSRIEMNRANGQGHCSSSYGKSSGKAADDVKDLKGALRSSEGRKSKGNVTFQLPNSPARSPSNTYTPSTKQSDSPVQKLRTLAADMTKQSSSSLRVARHRSSISLPPKLENYIKNQNFTSPRVSKERKSSVSFSGSPSKRKKPPRSLEQPFNSRGQRNYGSFTFSSSSSLMRKKSPRSPEPVNLRGNNNSPSPQVSKKLSKSPSVSGSPSSTRKKSPSVSGSPSSTRKKSPRSSQTDNLCGNLSSGGNSVAKRYTDRSIPLVKQESPRKT